MRARMPTRTHAHTHARTHARTRSQGHERPAHLLPAEVDSLQSQRYGHLVREYTNVKDSRV
jgi:hypothetical protein